MFEIVALKKWFMESLTGVITLGALGSILGTVLVSLLRRMWKRLYESRKKLLFKVAYPLGKQIEIGRVVNKNHSPKGDEGQFLVYHIGASASSAKDFMIFLCFVTLAAHVAIAYGIERPILLSSLIALTLISAFGALKSSLRVHSHISSELSGSIRSIKKEFPKSSGEWLKQKTKSKEF